MSRPLGVYQCAMVMYRPAFVAKGSEDVHATLAEGRVSNYCRAPMVLQCPGEHLTGAAAAAVHEHHHRNILGHATVPDLPIRALTVAILDVEHQSVIEELAGHVHHGIEGASRIVPQV